MNKIKPRYLDIVAVHACGCREYCDCSCGFSYRLVSRVKEGGFRNYFDKVGGITTLTFPEKNKTHVINRFSLNWFLSLLKIF